MASEVDYAEEGRRLLHLVNLGDVGMPERYSGYSMMWKHKDTGAVLFVGNAATAGSKKVLDEIGVRHIVFCQQSDGKCHFEGDPSFHYLKFPIGVWRQYLPHPDDASTLEYFDPLFSFVRSNLDSGNNVLIHCLAGAHRAGTAGISCLMHLCHIDKHSATALAKRLRPAIDPIGSFPSLLEHLDHALRSVGHIQDGPPGAPDDGEPTGTEVKEE